MHTHTPQPAHSTSHGPPKTRMAPLPLREHHVQFRVQTLTDGTVRLEQMAFSRTSGWYVQKSLRIPPEMVHAVLQELRKADCLRPRRTHHSSPPGAGAILRLAD